MRILSKLEAALVRRSDLLSELKITGTNAYRFFNNEGEGIPGLVIECFGSFGVLNVQEDRCQMSSEELHTVAQWCIAHLGLAQVYLKSVLADRSGRQPPAELRDPNPLAGPPATPEIWIEENRNRFLVRPYDGYSVGLFLDQRDNRKAVAEGAKGLNILNLFSYTGGFSVYCARAGATVTSVDISSRYLEWSKENFKGNGLACDAHRFFCADARYFLKAAFKRQEQYDRILLDPPSFARGRDGEPFSVRKDLAGLIVQCAELLTPDGDLFISTNYSRWTEADLEETIFRVLGRVKFRELPPVPQDFFNGQEPVICRWVQG